MKARWGVAFDDLCPGEEGVTATLRRAEGGTERVRCRYLGSGLFKSTIQGSVLHKKQNLATRGCYVSRNAKCPSTGTLSILRHLAIFLAAQLKTRTKYSNPKIDFERQIPNSP